MCDWHGYWYLGTAQVIAIFSKTFQLDWGEWICPVKHGANGSAKQIRNVAIGMGFS